MPLRAELTTGWPSLADDAALDALLLEERASGVNTVLSWPRPWLANGCCASMASTGCSVARRGVLRASSALSARWRSAAVAMYSPGPFSRRRKTSTCNSAPRFVQTINSLRGRSRIGDTVSMSCAPRQILKRHFVKNGEVQCVSRKAGNRCGAKWAGYGKSSQIAPSLSTSLR